MNKKILITIILVLIIVCGVFLYFKLNRKNNNTSNINNSDLENNSKVLVVYFSAQSHTKSVALKIADNLNADVFEIVPKDIYTSEDLDYTDSTSRVSMEYADESLRNIELEVTDVPNWDSYDIVLIGYPIWWGNTSNGNLTITA